MSRGIVYFISDDQDAINNAKVYWESQGVTFQSYTQSQWQSGLESSSFRSQLGTTYPQLNAGSSNSGMLRSNILPFPGQMVGQNGTPSSDSHSSMTSNITNVEFRASQKVSTMDEIESQAIITAIAQYKGNLTEAAKALGIGRATLYRKVKLYKIDPTEARRKKAA
jgi:DNA-binding NtrC family response regulator